MQGVFRVSEAASLALLAMTFLAAHNDSPHSNKAIAERLDVSEAHLSKVLQRLSKGRLVRSIRGPKGGFIIEGSPASIRLLDVYECIDGELPVCDCLLTSPVCSGKGCIFGALPAKVSRQLRNYMETTKISDFAHLWQKEERYA
jgi:Rrf2 family protein